jgi:hypothetical protein
MLGEKLAAACHEERLFFLPTSYDKFCLNYIKPFFRVYQE